MSSINFGKRLDNYVERRKKHSRQELRTIKLIAETARKILANNSKRLTTADLNDICLKVYNKVDTTKRIRVYNMINQPDIKERIENSLIQAYINRGIEPIKKAIELADKAESVAKTTSDYMQMVKHYQDVAKLSPQTTVRQTEKVNYNELLEPVSTTITREVSTTIPAKCENNINEQENG